MNLKMIHPRNIKSTGKAREILGLDGENPNPNYAANMYWDACNRLEDAEKIMEKFVAKVESGKAQSVETYAEMTKWLRELKRS